eukprot:Plantae.Rhodophyta-Hildenbrandia_rubra.ctg3638.p1 GENE.Plantae.Rhodophyta-Hildenbrandia_rubra.ctg3638~~Plantae.Rhodophyta-Hildenbrandia_rubra.ctg3638.p1  ORF type:complete len:732 (-),score=106.62 Plantae.Rhodophyta-Hildenbrandia_rubra.ctg3638:1155-3350(-)
MGLLSLGTPLTWKEAAPYRAAVKRAGIEQFVNIYETAVGRRNEVLKWGDEVEYMLLAFTEDKRVRLLLRGPEILEELQKEEHAQPQGSSVPVLWRPEYATWMVEGTPGVPYRCYATDLGLVERNMRLRRREIDRLLGPNECVLTITAFPRTGCGAFTMPPSLPMGRLARSLFTSDDAINPHPRFGTLTRNVRARRGRKVDIRVPLFKDINTRLPTPLVSGEQMRLLEAVPDTKEVMARNAQTQKDADTAFMSVEEAKTLMIKDIYMDSAAFGMGCCCLQITLQARDIGESRYLYDQLAVMAPLMMALTAATPILHGQLADTDTRWDVISAAMDDRTAEEINCGRPAKSRYSSIDMFISDRVDIKLDRFNDIPIQADRVSYQTLRKAGVDERLALHISHLFIREPLVLFKEKLDLNDTTSADHFENIQSTNWNSVRFKPPPPGGDIGWRTEFRTMEVQLTDFENAAFSVFTVLLSRVIIAFDLNLYIPMSRVDSNMQKAAERDAARKGRFLFRKNIFSNSKSSSSFICSCGHIHQATIVGGNFEGGIEEFCTEQEDADPFDAMSIDEIFNGKPLTCHGQARGFAFPGLIPLIRGYLDSIEMEVATKSLLSTYMEFVAARASGNLCTTATHMRRFVQKHPKYRKDSNVGPELTYDLLSHCRAITAGVVRAPELLGKFFPGRHVTTDDTAASMMEHMSRKPVGSQAGHLHGASLPQSAVQSTIEKLAMANLRST